MAISHLQFILNVVDTQRLDMPVAMKLGKKYLNEEDLELLAKNLELKKEARKRKLRIKG